MSSAPPDSVPPRFSRRDVASHERRDQVMDAAARVFAQKGFNAASIREIANEAGMSHTGVLHHYPDKGVLLEALLERRGQRAAADVGLDFSDGLEFLRGLVALAERDITQPEGLIMYSIVAAEALAPAHPANAYFRRWYEFVRATTLNALLDIEERDLYSPSGIPLELAAVQIAGLRDGLNQQWLLNREIDLVAAFRGQLQLYVSEPL